MITRGSRALRCGRRRSSRRSSGPCIPFTKRAQQELSRFVRTSARQQFVGPLLSLRGFPGRLRVGRAGKFRLARSPPLSRRGAWEEERKAFPCCSAAALACAALMRRASGIPRGAFAPNPIAHDQRVALKSKSWQKITRGKPADIPRSLLRVRRIFPWHGARWLSLSRGD